METAKQFSVYLENKPGRLARVLSALAQEKINLVGVTVMDFQEHGVLRFVASDPARTVQVLKTLGASHDETAVLLVELPHHPGAMAQVCELLGAEHIAINYAYCSAAGRSGKTVAIFKVSNPEKAMRVLGQDAKRSEGRPLRDHRTYRSRSSR
jgi:hypothetical protein